MAGKKFGRQKGRNPGASFVQIPHFVMESLKYADLDPYALKLLHELVRQYKGGNNGNLCAVQSELAARCRTWKSKDMLTKKLAILESEGWIVKTRQGSKLDGCNLFAVTWWPINACPGKHCHPAEHKPSHAWKKPKT